jgi:hypothetical protein
MDPFLILLLGLLAVSAIPGLVLVIADLLGQTETRHLSRHHVEDHALRESTPAGPLS